MSDGQGRYANSVVTETYGIGESPWLNPHDSVVPDGHYATASCPPVVPFYSEYLRSYNFAFNIPPTAVIDGIVVNTWVMEWSYPNAYSADRECNIIRNGNAGTVNKATGTHFPVVEGIFSYGSPTDLWGLTWTADEINRSDFGVRQAVTLHSTFTATAIARIDAVEIIVYYTVSNVSVSVAVVGRKVTSSRGILTRSGSATFGLTGVGTTAAYAGSAPLGTAGASLIGRSAATSPGTIFAAAPGAGMFLWNWTYGVDAYWHEVLGSLMPETGAFISGVSAAGSVGTIVSTTNAQVALSGVEVTSAVGTHIGYSYAEAFITGVHVHSSVGNVSPSAHGDVNVPIVGRYATASIGTLIAAGTSVGFASGVWLLYPVTIFVEQQWQCDIEVSEVHNV
jgi:hypothetical protein